MNQREGKIKFEKGEERKSITSSAHVSSNLYKSSTLLDDGKILRAMKIKDEDEPLTKKEAKVKFTFVLKVIHFYVFLAFFVCFSFIKMWLFKI